MTNRDRRGFLKGCVGAASSALLPASVQRALAAPPRGGALHDVRHVVILMQENRAFDHYFGAMHGVRGFSDRFPVPLPNGDPVWQQRDAEGRIVTPWHLDTASTSAQRVEGTPHSWSDAQEAWNDGRMDRWLPAKTERSMGYYREEDIAFQYALANAFTLCDAYHASIQAGTNPNRLFHWTGTNDPLGRHGGPAIDNHDDDLGPATAGWDWPTYPERLQAAGVDWRIYQDMGDNFTNNPLEGFRLYRRVFGTDHPLAHRALTTHSLDAFERDVADDRLPAVSWLIASAKHSEHPDPSCPLWGAEYIARVLDVLASHTRLWNGTVLLINFDENDGFFDHVPPPAPPARLPDGSLHGGSSIALLGEHHLSRTGPARGKPAVDDPRWHGRGYGLGPRVPMYVISPWSRGGWVNSEVFDHTSVLRFLERRFGVQEPNISEWRRSICGDLTSTLDFSSRAPAEFPRWDVDSTDTVVARQMTLPKPTRPDAPTPLQIPRGVRPSRALPYALDVRERATDSGVQLDFINAGQAGAVFHVYDRLDTAPPPRRYTVGAGHRLRGEWSRREISTESSSIHLCVYAPNGFHREYRGLAGIENRCMRHGSGGVSLQLFNVRDVDVELRLVDHYAAGGEIRIRLTPGARWQQSFDLADSGHWYDLTLTMSQDDGFLRRWAGRIETGADGISDPG